MSTRVEVSSESGIVVLSDGQTDLPAGLDDEVLLPRLEPLSRSAQVFYLLTDDPVRYRLDVLVDEPLPAGLDRDFESLGGAFRLEAPNGRVALIGWDPQGQPCEAGSVAVAPGPQRVTVFGRRPFDGKRHTEDMAALLGADARFMHVVDRLGLLGCLPLVVVAIATFAARWRWLLYLVPVLVVSWLPYLVLKRGRRYRNAEARASAAEAARPHFVIRLAATREGETPGGFIRV
jgi:hypothetical protein